MSTAISSFRTYVSSNARGANPDVLDKYILLACREFCQKTKVWVEQLGAYDIEADVSTYALSHASADIISVKKVKVDGEVIDPVTVEENFTDDPDWESVTGTPTQYFFDTDNNLYLKPVPVSSITDGLVVWAALKPLLTATTVPDVIFNEYVEAIANGAASKILRFSSGARKEDIALADYLETNFTYEISKAKNKVIRGKTTARA